jgi:O-glycosyl hydrolase
MNIITITIDPSQTRQTLEGIGASLAWSGDPVGAAWSEAGKTRLADVLFCPQKGAGLSGVRFNIGAGGAASSADSWRHPECFRKSADAPFDASCHAGQQWFVRAAAERGASCRVAFANSPPHWLTRNGQGTQDKSQDRKISNLLPGAERAFAEFLADVVAHFAQTTFPFTALSPVNEPQWDWESGSQEGCRFDNDQILALAPVLREVLDKRGLSIEIDLPEAADLRFLPDDSDLTAPYIHGNEAHGGGKCREQIRDLHPHAEGKICGHDYWTYDPPEKSRHIREVVRTSMDRYLPMGRFWQSEVCIMEPGRDLGIETALRVARIAQQDFLYTDAAAWFWWLAISPYDYKDGLVYLEGQALDSENFHTSKTLWALGNFSRFIRPGWRRIALLDYHPEPESSGLYLSAWADPTGEKQAIVAVNTTQEPYALHAIGHLKHATPHTTSATQDLEAGTTQSTNDPLAIPAQTIVTWVLD